MVNKQEISLNKSTKEIIIKELSINNLEVYEFLKDKKSIEDWIVKALIIGCVGLKQMVLTDNVDFVEKEFNKFIVKAKEVFEKQAEEIDGKIESTFSLKNTESPLYQIKSIIEEYFDSKKGKFREIIDDYFNKDKGQIKELIDNTFDLNNKKSALSHLIEELKENSGMEEEAIKELLNPNKTDSPAWQLKDEILKKLNDIRENEIKDIRDEILKKIAIETERNKGTSKGIDFQDEVYETIESLAKPYEDKIIPTGEKRGIKDKKGDILIQLKNKKKIVVECKDSAGYSCKKTNEEIKQAMENRKASYGIFLFAKREEMPKEFCPIKITENYLVTYYEKENLYLSYRLARTLLLREEGSEDKIDLEKISSEINNIEEILKNIDNMQSKVTSILNGGDYLRTNIEKLRDGIEKSLNKIKNVLGDNFDESAIPESEEMDNQEEEDEDSEEKIKKLPNWMRNK